MKAASVSLLLGVCVLLLSAPTVSAVSLSVSPNLQQFFRGSSSVSLSCVDGWTVKRTRGGLTENCGAGAGFVVFNESSCVLDLSFSSHGSYFCENSSGQQSNEVSISVSAGSLILEIPALPVRTGSDITLLCRQKDVDKVAAYFRFNGSNVGSGRKSEHTITNIQQSDEGLYSCSTDTLGSSPQSFLRVRGPLPPHVQSTTACTSPGISAPPSSFPPRPSIIPAVEGLVSVVLLVLVGVLFFYRKLKGRSDSSPVDVTYAEVTTTQRGRAEVTYGQVVFNNKKKASRMTGLLLDKSNYHFRRALNFLYRNVITIMPLSGCHPPDSRHHLKEPPLSTPPIESLNPQEEAHPIQHPVDTNPAEYAFRIRSAPPHHRNLK
ncbi:uncharacterized protein LOC115775653 [Archocentrus centrarchus]|uniref:uncharacterized protein LOC115775653 n=1 Tax=Archocentrus centrarchus TaxID=63155 RepID=UPI0011E9F909|nr:uncharacterized protein LOC115775653 [Archocentrus centrarchus]